MDIIDLHCDTAHKIYHLEEKSLYTNSYSVDVNKLSRGNIIAQFFALFIDKAWVEENGLDIYQYTLDFYNSFISSIEENGNYIKLARNYFELKENHDIGKISAILTIEGGDCIEDRIERLDIFFNLGIRLITLTWNYENSIGYPNSTDRNIMDKGLKPFGFEVINRMNELGIIIDVSHLSDAGFYDCINHSKKPIVASHSNARAITDVTRNMTDDMMRTLADNGGVIGLNFCPLFLGYDNISKIDYLIHHLKHMKKVAGTEAIALGTDFDGIKGELEIANAGEIGKLITAMEKSGFSSVEIENICSKNAMRIIQECMIGSEYFEEKFE